LDEIRQRVEGELMREREEKALQDHVKSLRQQALIDIVRP
jgi:hypothetical protein